MYSYNTSGTCSRRIDFELENGIVKSVSFLGGCPGNTMGLSKVVVGRSAEEIIGLFSGITCGPKPTSCPDQLAKALKLALERENANA